MGYEVTMLVGQSGLSYPEYEDVLTGRTGRYFQVASVIELRKIGYAASLIKLIADSQKKSNNFTFFYAIGDGNLEVKEDKYGEMFNPVSIKDTIKAMKASFKPNEYRRIDWALALLEVMPKDFEVIFYGH